MYVPFEFDPSPLRTHSPPPRPLFRVDRADAAGQVTRGKDGRAADGHGAGRVLLIYTGGTMGMTGTRREPGFYPLHETAIRAGVKKDPDACSCASGAPPEEPCQVRERTCPCLVSCCCCRLASFCCCCVE